MTAHAQLTDTERLEAAIFWGNYFRAGGRDLTPSALQLDAVNDEALRDRLMMWQIGADVEKYNLDMAEYFATEYPDVLTALGDAPDPDDAMDAILTVVHNYNVTDVEADDLDTGTVFVLMYCMWTMLGGWFSISVYMLTALMRTCEVSFEKGITTNPHSAPLSGLGQLAISLSFMEKLGSRDSALREAANAFGFAEDDPRVIAAHAQDERPLPDHIKATQDAREQEAG
jgi:hypothetical protein